MATPFLPHVREECSFFCSFFLSSREIFEALRMLGIRDMPLSEVRALVGSFDDDNNGRLGREEFARLLRFTITLPP